MHRILVLFLAAIVNAFAAEKPSSVDALLNQAQWAHRKGKNSDAIAFATKAIEVDPKNAQTYFIRGRIYAEIKDHEQAIADLTHGIELEAKAPLAYQLRGAEYFKLGNFTNAIADFDKAIQFV